MAGSHRQPNDPVEARHTAFSADSAPSSGARIPVFAAPLIKHARQYSFYSAVNLLHDAFPDAPRVGYSGPPEKERIRLRPSLDAGFPISDIDTVEEIEMPGGGDNPQSRYVVNVAFMGLYGTSSPLPNHYTEDMLRHDEFDSMFRGFLDLFHHRLLSLLFRAWEKYRHAVQYRADARDYFSNRLLALGGVQKDQLPENGTLAAGRLLEYVGLLSQGASAQSLRAMISAHYPEFDVEIEQCVGAWTALSDDQTSRLGEANSSLGADAMLGSQVYNRSGGFGVRLGPMRLESYLAMLPGENDLSQLRELVDIINSDGLEYEVTLRLRGDEVPRARLGLGEGKEATTRLGWCSWLGESSGEDRSVTFKFRGWSHGRG